MNLTRQVNLLNHQMIRPFADSGHEVEKSDRLSCSVRPLLDGRRKIEMLTVSKNFIH